MHKLYKGFNGSNVSVIYTFHCIVSAFSLTLLSHSLFLHFQKPKKLEVMGQDGLSVARICLYLSVKFV